MTERALSYENVLEIQKLWIQLVKEYWENHVFLTGNWWLLLILGVFPWLLWWKLVDKERVFTILTFGLLYGIIAILLDEIGTNLFLWTYPVNITWLLIPALFPFNFTLIPITFMIIYQLCPRMKGFAIVSVILSFLISMVVEPVFVWLDIYELIRWQPIYSFPLYALISILLKLLVDKIEQSKYQSL